MSVDNNCNLQGREGYEEEQRKECSVPISAYSLEAGILLNWLEDYCRDAGLYLAGARRRLDRLRAMNAGWE